MGLRFRYKPVRVNHAVVPLGGRWVRPRPLITVSLIGPADTRALEAMLDTGSDDTVFPERFAAWIGLDLADASAGMGAGVGPTSHLPLRYAQVSLRITDGVETREWSAWVGFTPAKLARPLLGFAGFLQFFGAFFHGDREEVELTVNSLYPGT
jgi:hypothetical protein